MIKKLTGPFGTLQGFARKLEFKIDISFIDEFTGEALQGPLVLLNW